MPTQRFARDPVVAPDGSIYVSVLSGNKIARFERTPDGKTGKITEYKMPASACGLAIDQQGNIWVCRYSADKLGKPDPKMELSLRNCP